MKKKLEKFKKDLYNLSKEYYQKVLKYVKENDLLSYDINNHRRRSYKEIAQRITNYKNYEMFEMLYTKNLFETEKDFKQHIIDNYQYLIDCCNNHITHNTQIINQYIRDSKRAKKRLKNLEGIQNNYKLK